MIEERLRWCIVNVVASHIKNYPHRQGAKLNGTLIRFITCIVLHILLALSLYPHLNLKKLVHILFLLYTLI